MNGTNTNDLGSSSRSLWLLKYFYILYLGNYNMF